MSFADGTRIRISSLLVRYPDRDRPALRGVSERIEPGEVVVVTGPSGCGKSTLCRVLAGFIPGMIPAEVEGKISLDGVSVWEADPASIATHLGLVQQDPDAQICTLNVWEEVAFGPENLCLHPDEVTARVEQSLDFVGIAHLVERETTTLSGGEKQRLAIASILAMRPEVILLDEPTANLDPEGAKTVFDLLGNLRESEGRTLIVVEHRLEPLLTLNPRLLILDKGEIVTRRTTRRHMDLDELGLRAHWDLHPPSIDKGREKAALTVEDLTFGYNNASLLEHFSLGLRPGEILGVIGPNGGGKTTLLRLIAGLEHPSKGRVVRSKDPTLGFVFQHPHQQIFERTVRGEFEIEGGISQERLRHTLSEAKLAGLEEVPPLSLSLGEQRRLTLATALSRDPNLILLDEPFIGQDRWNVMWIVSQILTARQRGAVTLLVSHDIPLVAALCDRILYLGQEAVEGEPDAVFSRLEAMGKEAFLPTYWEGMRA